MNSEICTVFAQTRACLTRHSLNQIKQEEAVQRSIWMLVDPHFMGVFYLGVLWIFLTKVDEKDEPRLHIVMDKDQASCQALCLQCTIDQTRGF